MSTVKDLGKSLGVKFIIIIFSSLLVVEKKETGDKNPSVGEKGGRRHRESGFSYFSSLVSSSPLLFSH